MTNRRWMADTDPDGQGPLEERLRAELEQLGWTPLSGPGRLTTLAEQAVNIAEVLDHTMNASALPNLHRALLEVMAQAVQEGGKKGNPGVGTVGGATEVVDFEQRRQRREGPPGR